MAEQLGRARHGRIRSDKDGSKFLTWSEFYDQRRINRRIKRRFLKENMDCCEKMRHLTFFFFWRGRWKLGRRRFWEFFREREKENPVSLGIVLFFLNNFLCDNYKLYLETSTYLKKLSMNPVLVSSIHFFFFLEPNHIFFFS